MSSESNFIRRKQRLRNKFYRMRELGQINPRVVVFRSNKYFYAQVVDVCGNVCLSVSSKDKDVQEICKASLSSVEAARITGVKLSEKFTSYQKELSNEWIFDRSGYKYHGRVKAFADGLREKGNIKI